MNFKNFILVKKCFISLLQIIQLPSSYKNNSLIFNLTYLLMVVSTFLFNSGLILILI
jgi:hypothetical protein